MNKTKDIVGRCVKIFARRILAPALIGGESFLTRQEAKALERFGLLGFWIGMMVAGGRCSTRNHFRFNL